MWTDCGGRRCRQFQEDHFFTPVAAPDRQSAFGVGFSVDVVAFQELQVFQQDVFKVRERSGPSVPEDTVSSKAAFLEVVTGPG